VFSSPLLFYIGSALSFCFGGKGGGGDGGGVGDLARSARCISRCCWGEFARPAVVSWLASRCCWKNLHVRLSSRGWHVVSKITGSAVLGGSYFLYAKKRGWRLVHDKKRGVTFLSPSVFVIFVKIHPPFLVEKKCHPLFWSVEKCHPPKTLS
jgi:hypothetical protein